MPLENDPIAPPLIAFFFLLLTTRDFEYCDDSLGEQARLRHHFNENGAVSGRFADADLRR